MEQLIVNRTSGLPPYRQLSGHLSGLIHGRQLRPGERLPAVREMTRTYGLSTNTVQKALQELKSGGLVVGRQGDGLFVSECVPDATAETQAELRVNPIPWTGAARAGVLNRFHGKHPRTRIVEGPAESDLRWMEQGLVAQQADLLEDVTDLTLEAYGRTEADAGVLDSLRVDGRFFMLPMTLNVQVTACNVDVFDRCGVALPPPDWDWQEYLEISAALARADATIAASVVYLHWNFFLPLVWQAGGAIYSADGRRCLLAGDEAMEAARHVRARGGNTMELPGQNASQAYDLLAQGRAAMTAAGTWGYYDLNQRGHRWVARPLPTGRCRATWMSARGYSLSRRCPCPGAARQFLLECSAAALGSEERDRRPATPLHRALELNGETERTYRAALRDARLWLSDIQPEHRTPQHLSALCAINRYVGPLLFGTEPVESLMRNLNHDIEAMLTSEEQASGR